MLILKGIIVGIGKIIPGVSGAMIAISLGIYQPLIDCINNLFKDFKNNICFLIKIGIGVLISIVFFSKIITASFKFSYISTIFFFIGLIMGSLDNINKNIDRNNIYISILIFVIVLLLGLFNINNQVRIGNNLINFLFYILVGIIDAATMIIPGISGTATLMMIGAYDTLINSLSNLTNVYLIGQNVKTLFPFLLGLIIGTILTAKLIDFLFKNYKTKTYSAILGFSISTIILMALKCLKMSYSFLELVISFVLLFVGMIITKSIKNMN